MNKRIIEIMLFIIFLTTIIDSMYIAYIMMHNQLSEGYSFFMLLLDVFAGYYYVFIVEFILFTFLYIFSTEKVKTNKVGIFSFLGLIIIILFFLTYRLFVY